jgi:hypothetical protein
MMRVLTLLRKEEENQNSGMGKKYYNLPVIYRPFAQAIQLSGF